MTPIHLPCATEGEMHAFARALIRVRVKAASPRSIVNSVACCCKNWGLNHFEAMKAAVREDAAKLRELTHPSPIRALDVRDALGTTKLVVESHFNACRC